MATTLKKNETQLTPIEAPKAPPSLEELMADGSLDGLMTLGKRLGDLTQAASIALSNFHFTNSRVDQGNYREGHAHTGAPFDQVAMARLTTMATACREFSHAMRNARLIGVHDQEEREKILVEYLPGLATPA